MRFSRIAAAVSAFFVVGVVAVVSVTASAEPSTEEAEAVLSAGSVPVDDADFDLALERFEQRAEVRSVREDAFADCLVAAGFGEEVQIYLDAQAEGHQSDLDLSGERYSQLARLAIGDQIQDYTVALANGTEVVVSGSWTEESCFWQSYETVGSYLPKIEALRQSMAQILIGADAAAAEDERVLEIAERAQECTADGSVPALFFAVRFDEASCIEPADEESVRAAISVAHRQAAIDNAEIVAEWAAEIDKASK